MKAIVQADHLVKTYPTRPPSPALRGFSLTVPKAVAFGILGPNGAGKSTFIRILIGTLLADSGSISVMGLDPAKAWRTVAKTLRFVPETPYLLSSWSLWDNARYWFAIWEEKWDRLHVAGSLERFGLLERADEPLNRYSRGMRQRAGLALALATRAPLIVLDEPTLGLDVLGIQETLTILQEAKASDKTILFASHDMSFVEKLADSVALVAHGQVLEVDDVRAFRRKHGREMVTLRYRLPGQAEPVTERIAVDETFSEEKLWQSVLRRGGTLIELRRDLQPLEMVVGNFLRAHR